MCVVHEDALFIPDSENSSLLQILCAYLVKRLAAKEKSDSSAYPYGYLLSKGEGDTGLYGISKNGQYADFDKDFPGAEHALTKCVNDLSRQNRVRISQWGGSAQFANANANVDISAKIKVAF